MRKRNILRRIEQVAVGLLLLLIDSGVIYGLYYFLTANPLSTILTALIIYGYGFLIVIVICVIGWFGLLFIFGDLF